MSKRIVIVSVLPGSVKTTATALKGISADLTQQGKTVLSVTSDSTYLGLRQAIQRDEPYAVLIDNDGNERSKATDLAKKLAHKFPEVFFYVTE